MVRCTFLHVPENPINTSELSEELLNHGVAIAPGIGFGDYNEFFRISACLDINNTN